MYYFFLNSTSGEGVSEDRLQAGISHVRFTEGRELFFQQKKIEENMEDQNNGPGIKTCRLQYEF
jgi:hypothetical protein